MKKDPRRRAMAILRAASTAAALLALAGASLPLPTTARSVVLLFDASDSIGREGVESSRAAALALVGKLHPRDRVGALAFAGGTSLISEPVAPAQAEALLESASLTAPSPGSTDLSAAIAAAAQMAAGAPGSETIFLFSDGRSNAGRTLTEGLAAESGGSSRGRAAIEVVPVGRTSAMLVARGLSPPEVVHPGERVSLAWKLFSARPLKIDYEVLVDGAVAKRGEASLAAGLNEVPVEVEAGPSGLHSVIVEATGAGQQGEGVGEARSGAYLEVGGAARILVVSGAASGGVSPIASALRAQGMEVDTGGPEVLPEEAALYAGRSAVVLDDLSALDITEAQQASLQDYVAGGGGLLVVGGESSLGRGEYYATPLEDMLPVSTDDRQRLLFTRARLLFVIDHSGSMSETVGSETKQMIAMRGVAASIEELNPLDEVGILGFDSNPTWVIPFTPASERKKNLASLSGLGEGGGTDLAVAMEEALRGFGDPGPTKRHAIILTDGLTPEVDFRGLCSRFAAAQISVSTIGIGEEVNDALLKDIADWCGGRYYHSTAAQIPTIIDKETVRMTRDLIQEGRIETRLPSQSPVTEGLGSPLPPIGGYLLTRLKPLASAMMEARNLDGGSRPWDPLLSSWRYGNGRVAVFAGDSGAHWLSAWSGTSAYNRLWSQTLRSIERASPEASLRVSATAEGGMAHIEAEAIGQDGRSASSLSLVGIARGAASGAESGRAEGFELEETAPGRYEGYARLGTTGLVGFQVLDPVTGAGASTWVWSPPDLESGRLGADETSLALIASSTGGRVFSAGPPEPPPPATRWAPVPIRLPLTLLAALLLVGELYLRSTMTGQFARAATALASWRARAMAEATQARRWPATETSGDEERERRSAEMRRRMAERVAKRYEKAEAEASGDESA
jgi:uncharacterized membrane protein